MNYPDALKIAEAAWNASKNADQPEWAEVSGEYRSRLLAEIEAIEKHGVTEGDAFHAAVQAEIETLAAGGVQSADETAPVVDQADDGSELTPEEIADLKAQVEAETGRSVSQVETLEEYTAGDAALAAEIEAQVEADTVETPTVTPKARSKASRKTRK